MLILLEGVALSFVLLIVCAVGIANGPVGSVYFYEKDVQERVVELGLTTKEKIKRGNSAASTIIMISVVFFTPAMVYFINGARDFWGIFWQITVVLLIAGLFDRIFIDWFWVGKTKAWLIPGTEDLMPYIPKKTLIIKWAGTVIGFPIIAAIISAVIILFSSN